MGIHHSSAVEGFGYEVAMEYYQTVCKCQFSENGTSASGSEQPLRRTQPMAEMRRGCVKSQKSNHLLERFCRVRRPKGACEINVPAGVVFWKCILSLIHPTDFSHSLSAYRSLPCFRRRSACDGEPVIHENASVVAARYARRFFTHEHVIKCGLLSGL